jgi:hypothetical protein
MVEPNRLVHAPRKGRQESRTHCQPNGRARRHQPRDGTPGTTEGEAVKEKQHPGITPRVDQDGRTRFQVRVRRNGRGQIATLGSLEEALAWRAQALAAAEGRGEAPEAPRPLPPVPEPSGRAVTVTDAAKRLARGMRDGTIRARGGTAYKASVTEKYETALRCLVIPRIGAVPIATLTGGDVQRLVDEIAAERTPEHARKALTGLRVALRVAQRYGELDSNPCAGTRVPISGEAEKPATILTPEQASAIVAAADADDARLKRSLADCACVRQRPAPRRTPRASIRPGRPRPRRRNRQRHARTRTARRRRRKLSVHCPEVSRQPAAGSLDRRGRRSPAPPPPRNRTTRRW